MTTEQIKQITPVILGLSAWLLKTVNTEGGIKAIDANKFDALFYSLDTFHTNHICVPAKAAIADQYDKVKNVDLGIISYNVDSFLKNKNLYNKQQSDALVKLIGWVVSNDSEVKGEYSHVRDSYRNNVFARVIKLMDRLNDCLIISYDMRVFAKKIGFMLSQINENSNLKIHKEFYFKHVLSGRLSILYAYMSIE